MARSRKDKKTAGNQNGSGDQNRSRAAKTYPAWFYFKYGFLLDLMVALDMLMVFIGGKIRTATVLGRCSILVQL